MNRFDYNFTEYSRQFNRVAKRILTEEYAPQERVFDADEASRELDEAQLTYQKIQRILNCPEMIKSHAYLYSLDMENVDESDKAKVENLYNLAKARGLIQETEPEAELSGETAVGECDMYGDQICGGPQDALTGQEMVPAPVEPPKQSSAFTVLYSAMKDGQVKTGEYFSSATDVEAAKRDCVSSLTPLGYSSIRVLGIEQANDAVDTSTIDEGDEKEYEEQETGSGDTTEEKPKEQTSEQPAEEKPEGEKPAEEKPEGEKPAEQPAEEKPAEEKPAEQPAEEKPAEQPAEQKPAEQPAEEPKKLTADEKNVLHDEYIGVFKSVLQSMGIEKSVDEMNLKERTDFYTKLTQRWTKNDPEEFLSKKEIEKLDSTVIKAG